MREAARWTSAGMAAAMASVAEGRTDNEVAAEAYLAMIRAGSEYMCYAPIVTTGKRSGIPHSTHRRVRIDRGDPVFIELGACCNRYSAPLMRTAVAGVCPDPIRRLADAARSSVEALIENIAPGAIAHDVARKAATALRGIPESVIWHGYYGYSIGLGFPPEWNDGPALIRENSDLVLQAGMVFHCSTSLREIRYYGATSARPLRSPSRISRSSYVGTSRVEDSMNYKIVSMSGFQVEVIFKNKIAMSLIEHPVIETKTRETERHPLLSHDLRNAKTRDPAWLD